MSTVFAPIVVRIGKQGRNPITITPCSDMQNAEIRLAQARAELVFADGTRTALVDPQFSGPSV